MPIHFFRPLTLGALMLLACLSAALPLGAATLTVGPGKTYAAPCAAIAAAADGDTIEIDSTGNYAGDVCSVAKNRLTLRGVGGRAKIDAAGKNYGGKGIWVISGNDTTVENIEFSGAVVPDQNGAGIRQEGSNLTVRGCYFHDNEDGILSGGSASSEIIIEYSEFANNGFGDGFSHNMYIGHEGRFTLRYSYSHAAKVGHLVKSRAAENYILYNRLSGEDGTASYELDLPNAGTSYVIGNLIEQGPSTQNSTFMTYGVEGTAAENPGHALFVVNNTFVNDRPAGATFITVGGAISTAAVITNNIFFGGGTITNQASASQVTNFSQGNPMLVNPAAYDYQLMPGSPCINAGSDPGMGAGFALAPAWQYVHPAGTRERRIEGAIDIGAYEFGSSTDAGSDATIRPDGSAGGGGASPADAAREGASGRDASVGDDGAGGRDTGAGDDDGAGGRDAGTGGDDGAAGSPPSDAGATPPGGSGATSGCGCRAASHDKVRGATLASLMLMLAVGRRARSRSSAGRGTRADRDG